MPRKYLHNRPGWPGKEKEGTQRPTGDCQAVLPTALAIPVRILTTEKIQLAKENWDSVTVFASVSLPISILEKANCS